MSEFGILIIVVAAAAAVLAGRFVVHVYFPADSWLNDFLSGSDSDGGWSDGGGDGGGD